MTSINGLIPHGFCINWTPALLWSYVISDALITLAYFSIPFALIYFVLRRRNDLKFRRIFLMFGAFILACGTTHLMSIVLLWNPVYWLDAGIKMVTAAISVGTAICLFRALPQALRLPSPAQLEAEIKQRENVQQLLLESEKQQQRLAEEADHRDTLVREVHHRIKNNLQGITGMLRQFAETHPDTAGPINQAISQMQSIAVIHGLQGRSSLPKVRLCELTSAITREIESLWHTPIAMDIPSKWTPSTITESEAVPLALVLNELISNAVKHGGRLGQVKVMLRQQPDPDMIQVSISNFSQLPPDFDFERNSTTSNGLQLVASLLPRSGAKLSWQQQDNTVTTLLDLRSPVVTLEAYPLPSTA